MNMRRSVVRTKTLDPVSRRRGLKGGGLQGVGAEPVERTLPAGPQPMALGIARRDGEYRVIAREPFDAGDVLLVVEGILVDNPSRYSVQVGVNLHVAPPPGLAPDDDSERYRWRYLNHSCRPNAAFRGRVLVALTSIARGEEIAFDYNTTELDMASPFKCRCGHCGGRMIRGVRHLKGEERRRREPWLSEHIRIAVNAG